MVPNFNHWWTKTYGLGEIVESKNEMVFPGLERYWPFDSPFHLHWLHQTRRVKSTNCGWGKEERKTPNVEVRN